ncbi:MAG: hypothetical protein PHF84_04115 [bacterium]|nr:hypothetical protein [bacterium]
MEKKDLAGTDKVQQAFGIYLPDLPVEWNGEFIRNVRKIIGQGPFLGKKSVLLLSNPQFKYHEKHILLYLSYKFKKIDCCCVYHPDYSLKAKLKSVRYIPLSDITRSCYDYIIVYKCLGFFSGAIDSVRAGKYYVLMTGTDISDMQKDPGISRKLSRSGKKVVYFNLFKHTISRSVFPGQNRKKHAAINWPPTLDVFYKVPREPLFDLLFMGGAWRNYKFLYENRRIFGDKKVIITHCDARMHSGGTKQEFNYDSKYISLLKKERNMICLDRLNESLYCRLLLYTKSVICLFRHPVQYDSGCISDALWYGKPVITNKTLATRYLKNHVLYVASGREFGEALKKLEDPEFYRQVSRKAMDYAGRENNIFSLLKKIE